MLNILIPITEDGSRLDRCIRRLLGNINQAVLEKLLRSGLILLDKKKVKSSSKVKSGQYIHYSSNIEFKNINSQTLNKDASKYYTKLYNKILIHETKDYLVINKPSGLAVQGGSKQEYHIDDMLKYIFKGKIIPKLIHRIDKDTSGLLLIAKDQISAKILSAFFKEHKIIKTYLAIVSPCPMSESGIIDKPLYKFGSNFKQKMIIDPKNGKIAVTQYKILDKLGSSVALMALYPKTGRTHQLRAHLEHINAPIIGDKKYKGHPVDCSLNKDLFGYENISELSLSLNNIKNLQLHAYSIRMPSNEIIIADINDNFKKNLKLLGLTIPKNINNIFKNTGEKF